MNEYINEYPNIWYIRFSTTVNYIVHNYACYMSNLLTCVRKLQRWHEQKHPVLSGWSTAWQTEEEDLHLKACSKMVIVSSLHVSWRTSQTVGDHTLLQIWWPQTTLSIRCTASLSDKLAITWIRKIAHVHKLPSLSAD